MKVAHNFLTQDPASCQKPAVQPQLTLFRLQRHRNKSVIEISHRSKEWEAVMAECRALWKEILGIPEGYQVLFMGGGQACNSFMLQ